MLNAANYTAEKAREKGLAAFIEGNTICLAFAIEDNKGSRLIGKIRSIRFVTMDIAIMIAVSGTVMAGQSDIEPERNSIHTIVAVKRDSRWYFTAVQNSRAQHIERPEESQALTEELRQELLMVSKRKTD